MKEVTTGCPKLTSADHHPQHQLPTLFSWSLRSHHAVRPTSVKIITHKFEERSVSLRGRIAQARRRKICTFKSRIANGPWRSQASQPRIPKRSESRTWSHRQAHFHAALVEVADCRWSKLLIPQVEIALDIHIPSANGLIGA